MTTVRLTDDQRLAGATYRGRAVPWYDDGDGLCYVFRDSLGVRGIVRARSWTEAWEICEDEFADEASETLAELQAEYGFRREHKQIIRDKSTGQTRPAVPADYPLAKGQFSHWETTETPDPEAWAENELFQEAYGFRPSGPRAGTWPDGRPKDPLGHGIYAKDLNGEKLDELTQGLAEALEIELTIALW